MDWIKQVLHSKNIYILDFIFALAGGLLYFFLFDFMVETLSLPYAIVKTQLIANFLYGIYGLVVYLRKVEKVHYFKFLVIMNFIYAGFCAVVGVMLVVKGLWIGAVLLFAEGLLIATLAYFEHLVNSDLHEHRSQKIH